MQIGHSATPLFPGFTGWVYVLSNPGHNYAKIGFTKECPYERAKELSRATGVTDPYEVHSYWQCKNPYAVEQAVHKHLADYRHRGNKEFFNVTLESANRQIVWILDQMEEGLANSDSFKNAMNLMAAEAQIHDKYTVKHQIKNQYRYDKRLAEDAAEEERLDMIRREKGKQEGKNIMFALAGTCLAALVAIAASFLF